MLKVTAISEMCATLKRVEFFLLKFNVVVFGILSKRNLWRTLSRVYEGIYDWIIRLNSNSGI